MKKGLYAGSFNPFTNGHLSMVEEASSFFDKLYVCLAVNSDKVGNMDNEAILDRVRAIEVSIAEKGLTNVEVVYHNGLIANLCTLLDVDYLVRGLRNTSDYLYEENIAKINSEINPNLKTIYFRSSNEVISSSLVRELLKYGEDISKYVPKPVYNLLMSGR